MTSTDHDISVLIPVYNAERYLDKALASVAGQTYMHWQAILLDDGSNDGSLTIMEEWAKRDARFRVHTQKNQGLPKTLNKLISLVEGGEFIARMDADDICMPERFEKQRNFLMEHPEVVVVGSGHLDIDEYDLPIEITRKPLDHKEILDNMFCGIGGQIMHPTMLIRRTAIEAIGGYREQFKQGQDYDLLLRLSRIGRLANIEDLLINYRRHPDSITATRRKRQVENTIIMLKDFGITNLENLTLQHGNLPQTPIDYEWFISSKARRAGYFRTAAVHAYQAWKYDRKKLGSLRAAMQYYMKFLFGRSTSVHDTATIRHTKKVD